MTWDIGYKEHLQKIENLLHEKLIAMKKKKHITCFIPALHTHLEKGNLNKSVTKYYYGELLLLTAIQEIKDNKIIWRIIDNPF